ncbi:trypsin-like peptidase domain-containing protein [Micromonospora sp. NPDC004540]|uniref:trypsin-like peptidase domain-containing protein n=1 Tax=Micromonospora sp. NPDC004540 TaxID=3154457 RepID=UPI0033A296DC
MQPVGPYRFTEALGVCQVGTAWWAIDGQDRLVTVAVLDGAAATDQPWREAFANAANAMAHAQGGLRYVNADFAGPRPWVAYPAEEGMGAQRLFQNLGMDLHPAEAQADILIPAAGTVTEPPRQVSAAPISPSPTSGPPQLPWAMHAAVPQQQGAIPPQQTPVPQQAVAPQQPAPEPVPTSPAPVAMPVSVPPADPFHQPVRRIQPTESGARGAGRGAALWLAVAALALGIVAAVGGVGVTAAGGGDDPGTPAPVDAFPTAAPADPGLTPWSQFPPSSPQERAVAVAGPSLVFFEAVFTGYLRDKVSKAPLRAAPIVFNRRCTGFVVKGDGHVLTSSSCVKPDEEFARRIALDGAARMMVREGRLTAAQVQGYITANLEKTLFTGVDPGTEPSSQLYAQLTEAKGNITEDKAVPARVVAAQTAATGNVALVKLDRSNLPAVELNPGAAVTESGKLLILGFGADDTDPRVATYLPRAKEVRIAGTGRRGAASMWRLADDIGGTSYGGIAVDTAGRVIGMLDQDLARPDRANRVVLPPAAFTELLSGANVTPGLGDSDKLYREGLDAYFTGRFPAAVERLATVAEGAPENRMAEAYRQNAANRQQLEGGTEAAEAPQWARWLLAGAGTALVLVLALLVAALVRRRG